MIRRAFTLIELLVVITIIAVLAALLFPVLGTAKAKAKQAKCIGNLRQVGTAVALYMSDWDDVYPHAVDSADKFVPAIWAGKPEWQAKIEGMPLFNELLDEYARSTLIYECPSDTGTKVLERHFPTEFVSTPSLFKTYGSSYLYRTEITFSGQTGSSLSQPTEINLFFDACGHWHGRGPALDASESVEFVPTYMRRFRYNLLYADQHIRNVGVGQLNRAWQTPLQ